jgi:hypothetical protein
MISAIPERLIQQALVSGLKAIKTNPKVLAAIFQNLTEPEFRRVGEFLTKTPINISINYPRQELKVPALCIMLKGEKESDPFMGDMMGSLSGFSPEAAMHYLDPSPVPHGLGGPYTKIGGPYTVTSIEGSSIEVSMEDFDEIFGTIQSVQELKLYGIAGPGKGKVYNVKEIEQGYIELQEAPKFVLLKEGSVFDLRAGSASLQVGEPQKVYKEETSVTRFGAMYDTTYTIDVMAASAEEVSYLYYLVKAIVYFTRESLESQGLVNITLTGEDMLYRAEFAADEVFHRVLKLSFKNIFSILIEDDILREFKVELC